MASDSSCPARHSRENPSESIPIIPTDRAIAPRQKGAILAYCDSQRAGFSPRHSEHIMSDAPRTVSVPTVYDWGVRMSRGSCSRSNDIDPNAEFVTPPPGPGEAVEERGYLNGKCPQFLCRFWGHFSFGYW